ncbi:hypothetical protein [Ornithinibacillus sp. JPR2-1]|uniref:hypothetical protein n=1 Tax=Ornithinibacillus sp. JPR2-1 TaxID=2094019 RepID=UPI0031D502D4
MAKQVLFLYKTIDEKLKSLLEIKEQGIYYLPNSTVIAIDTDMFPIQARKNLEKEYYLREFEVEQEKFINVIEKIPQIKARLLNVEINNSKYDPEMKDQLDKGILEQDYTKIIDILKWYKQNGNDINSLEIFFENGIFRMTRLAELDITKDEQEVNEILDNNFIKHLAGLTREVELS